ncbi:HK97 family phage prohead protease [Empedobacter sp.]|uniref:HK97 family phage prohead protease n=1 Tax=Empedobacter sp. TaxID=1927715 RepID=UPI0028A1D21B|nr:HK97 family phage prohead protease [Empedobacter sp.]
MQKSFVLNDENQQNNYGFRVLNAGINLERFRQNPVCLNDHRNNTKDVLGTWIDLKFEGSQFLGSPEFDTNDPEGKEVVRKVEAGKIKGCSLGFDFNPEDFEVINGEVVLTKCELKEISIVAIPSNSKTITLYNTEGKQLSASEIQSLCLSAKEQNFNPKDITMKKVISHLQLSDNSTEVEVLAAIQALELKYTTDTNQLKTEKAELKAKYDEVIGKQQAELKASYEAERDQAVKDGRIDEAGKAPIDEMVLKSGYEAGLKLLTSLPKRTPIAGKLETPAAQLAALEKMSWDELDKGNHLGKLKADNPDYYAQRFEQQFGKKPNQ